MDKNTHDLQASPFTAVIVAAGSGARFGDDLPKQYHKIHGKPVLRHTIEGFLRLPGLKQIQVVIADGFQNFYEESVRGLPKLLPPVIGGETRQESVYNALSSLQLDVNEIVLIHDAARPCFPQSPLEAMLGYLFRNENGAASLAAPVNDTLRRVADGDFGELVDRAGIYGMQTPQGFHFGILMRAHQKYKGQNFTDDTALVSELGVPVHLISGDRRNIKITLPEDLTLAAFYLQAPPLIPRTGTGFDVHAFGDASSSVRIGGIDIPHTHKLKGHSDADVLLHAITDALFGLISDGDIGSHFPPSNPDFKGRDSAFFLKYAVDAIGNASGKIIHVDTIIMCEAPKIGPHRTAMQSRIADIMGLKPSQVSVKATTTEELGFTGRREGIAAHAIVTALLPFEGN